jgi:hypothetical protein
MDWLMSVITYIGSALPLTILCLCLSVIIVNKKVSKKMLTSFIIIAVIMFFILLRS